MILSKTPLRVSFVGGGSDLPAYCERFTGAVVGAAINRHVYTILNRRFSPGLRVCCSESETAASIAGIRNDLVREALRVSGISDSLEILSTADAPTESGLGSSSSFTVGLLNALCAYQRQRCSPESLAQRACTIEIELAGRPIGKQDQYISAFGGLNFYQFHADGKVSVEPIYCSADTLRTLESRLMLFFVGIRGNSSQLLAEQQSATRASVEKQECLHRMVRLAHDMKQALNEDDLSTFGKLLRWNWELKKQLHPAISNSSIGAHYTLACENGALGGKILGAGGAGFLLLYSEDGKQTQLRAAMQRCGLREFPFRFDQLGSRIVANDEIDAVLATDAIYARETGALTARQTSRRRSISRKALG